MGSHMPVILAPGELKQEDCHQFKANLGYRVRPCLKKMHSHQKSYQRG